jgi:hypothetical protein
VIAENRQSRRTVIDGELRDLLYRRLLLERERDAIDKRIGYLEGALNENEATRRDADTEAAINQAIAEAVANRDGGS